MPIRHADITVKIDPPEYGESIIVAFRMTEREWHESGLGPLPKDHDNPFEPLARQEAERQLAKRKQAVDYLSRTLAHYILEKIQQGDPANGYMPGER